MNKIEYCVDCEQIADYDFSVDCVSCCSTYCESCWDTIEVPNGAADGDHEICSICISKF